MELVDKQAIIDAIVSGTIYETAEAIRKECQNPASDNDWIGGINDAIKTIEDIDGIEIVRCKDCEWRGTLGCSTTCRDEIYLPPDDWFCADGKRK